MGSTSLAAGKVSAELPMDALARLVARGRRERTGQSRKGMGAGAPLCPHDKAPQLAPHHPRGSVSLSN